MDAIPVSFGEPLQKRLGFDLVVDGRSLRYDVVKSEKYLSVEVFDGKEKVCGIMIVASPEGFSFFRTNGKNELGDKYIPSFVINFSENKIKFVTINDNFIKNKVGRKYETLISFNENGVMDLSSSDEIYSTVNTSEKVRVSNLTTFGE